MPRRLLTLVVLFTTFFTNGCGTVCNLVKPGNEKVLGGVRFDIEQIEKLGEPSNSGPLASSSGGGGGAVVALIMLVGPIVDIPLSFVGDILTLPLARRLDNRR